MFLYILVPKTLEPPIVDDMKEMANHIPLNIKAASEVNGKIRLV